MIRLLLSLSLCPTFTWSHGQEALRFPLSYYIEKAKENSPLIKDYKNQSAMQQAELHRLKDMYTHSRLEVNGDYLFVPIISKDGGQTTFKWNAQDGTDYYGYDLGESSGHLHAGLSWTKPLLGHTYYKAAQQQSNIEEAIANNRICMEEHALERSVTEQYILCRLDKTQVDFADSIATIIKKQIEMTKTLVSCGMAKNSDVHLLLIEQEANAEARTASMISFHKHLTDMNTLCGISDEHDVTLADTGLNITNKLGGQSLFAEQFKLDSLNAEASLRLFNQQYKPRLDLFANSGLQTGSFSDWHKHFGWSAGLTFAWTLSDGKQRLWKKRTTLLQQSTISTYRDHAEYQRKMRIDQCLTELAGYEERSANLDKQLAEYDSVLSNYEKEMQAGQISVLDYITVLRNKIKTERDRLLLLTNRMLVIAAYNYWNW